MLGNRVGRFSHLSISDVVILKRPYSVHYGPGFSFLEIATADTPRSKDGFKAYFPSEPEVEELGRQAIPGGSMTLTAYHAKFREQVKAEEGLVGVIVVRFPPGLFGPRMREVLLGEMRNKMLGRAGDTRISSPRQLTWAGYQAEEFTMEETGGGRGAAVMRFVVTDSAAYFVVLGSENGRLKPEDEKAFFDNFELLK